MVSVDALLVLNQILITPICLTGCPIEDPQTSDNISKVSANGKNRYASQLVQDLNTIDTVSHITRERIPERYTHTLMPVDRAKLKFIDMSTPRVQVPLVNSK